MSALSSGYVRKYELLPGKDLLPEKDLLEKAAAMEIFEYSPSDKELKAQNNIKELTILLNLIKK